MVADGRYLGYMNGTDAQVAAALAAMAPWQPEELTEAQVLARAESTHPVNSTSDDGRFFGHASIDDNGRVTQPLAFQEWQ